VRAARLPTFKLLTPLLLTLLFLTLGCTARRVSSGRLAKEGFEPSVEGRHGLLALAPSSSSSFSSSRTSSLIRTEHQ